MSRIALIVAASSLLAGCLDQLPDETELEWNRILAVRATPVAPEPDLLPRATLQPGEPARLDALLAGPEGVVDNQAVDGLWFACPSDPGAPAFSCFDDRFPLDLDALAACGEGLEEVCVLGTGVPTDMVVPTDPRLLQALEFEVLLVAADPEGDRTALECAETLLAGTRDTPNDCLFASSPVALAPPMVDELVNRHPQLSGFDVEQGGEVQSVELGAAVQARGRAVVRPRLQEGSEETYPVPVNDGSSTRDRDEELIVSWFRTGGGFTDAGFGGGGDDEDEVSWSRGNNGEGVSLIAVVRDGRGGVDWGAVQLDP